MILELRPRENAHATAKAQCRQQSSDGTYGTLNRAFHLAEQSSDAADGMDCTVSGSPRQARKQQRSSERGAVQKGSAVLAVLREARPEEKTCV